MSMSTSNDEYEIALIENETDAGLCAKLIAEEFALSNPFSIFLKTTPAQLYNTWIWPLMTDVLKQKLSFLVRYRPTNEIVAAIISSDFFLSYEKEKNDVSRLISSGPGTDLFHEMRDQFIHHDFHQELKPNMVLLISAGATKSEHSGKGIASQLRTHLCNYARDLKGFEYAYIQTAHPATRHIYIEKMNGKETTILHPATWLWKNNGDGSSRPHKDYKGEPIINILVSLK